ncbi:MAG: hypothetical protein PUC83_01240 [Fibrobacter sp.]|nr:hypothetical protein [Fibrobacter sp.]
MRPKNFTRRWATCWKAPQTTSKTSRPRGEAGCDRIFNKVMNFLDGAEEKSLKAIDKVQHSPIGVAIDQIYERNHRD